MPVWKYAKISKIRLNLKKVLNKHEKKRSISSPVSESNQAVEFESNQSQMMGRELHTFEQDAEYEHHFQELLISTKNYKELRFSIIFLLDVGKHSWVHLTYL